MSEKLQLAKDWLASRAGEMRRESGEKITDHCLWVGNTLGELNLGETTVIAGLLHEFTNNEDIEEISKLFGEEVALIIKGVRDIKSKTKEVGADKWEQNSFSHLLLALVGDVRVFIIRLVEQVSNSFSIENMAGDEQQKWAQMMLKIYGPMAETIGMNYYRRILEDKAFSIVNPKEYVSLKSKIENWQRDEIKAMALIKADINQLLTEHKFEAEIQYRIKGIYSTYLKSIKKNGLIGVKDRLGIRILTNTIEECYLILGQLHQKYKFLETELDDYIAHPKPNGYQSLQTALVWREKLTLEVQIRTKIMHEFNEYGPAAHLAYKGGNSQGLSPDWIKEMSSWKDENSSQYKLSIFEKFVYVLTPKNDIIQLPAGSTPLDLAYRIHSHVGNHALLAKVGGKAVKLNYQLKTGESVEIVTSKKSQPNHKWLEWVVTADAREQIRKKIGINN
jgi:RelA/SpoT family (p)ppGpp synthetase